MSVDARTVEVPLATAKTIARAVRYAEHVPALATAYGELARLIEEAERVPDFLERLRLGWDEGFARGRERAGGSAAPDSVDTRPRPEWANVAKATRIIDRLTKEDPAFIARADALGAYVRDTWDAQGLSLHDEQTVYVSLVMAGLMVEMSNNGRDNGMVETETVEAVARIAQTFTASILDYLPPECRA